MKPKDLAPILGAMMAGMHSDGRLRDGSSKPKASRNLRAYRIRRRKLNRISRASRRRNR